MPTCLSPVTASWSLPFVALDSEVHSRMPRGSRGHGEGLGTRKGKPSHWLSMGVGDPAV